MLPLAFGCFLPLCSSSDALEVLYAFAVLLEGSGRVEVLRGSVPVYNGP